MDRQIHLKKVKRLFFSLLISYQTFYLFTKHFCWW